MVKAVIRQLIFKNMPCWCTSEGHHKSKFKEMYQIIPISIHNTELVRWLFYSNSEKQSYNTSCLYSLAYPLLKIKSANYAKSRT